MKPYYTPNNPDYTRLLVQDALVRIKATRQMVCIILQIAELSGWDYALDTVKGWEGK